MKQISRIIICSWLLLMSLAGYSPAILADGPETESITVSLDQWEKNLTSTRVAVLTEQNEIADLWATGNMAGKYNQIDWEDHKLTEVSTNEDQNFSKYLGTMSNFNDNLNPDPNDAVTWLEMSNNSIIDPAFDPNFTISSEKEIIGSLKVDEELTLTLPVIGIKHEEIQLSINKPGFYVIFCDYNAIDTNSLYLIDPSNKMVKTNGIELPHINPGADPIKSAISFLAFEKGVFDFIFEPLSHQISFELKSYATTDTIKIGESISYQDLSADQIGPDSYLDGAGLPIQVYTYESKAEELLQISFDLIWGKGVSIALYIPNLGKYMQMPLLTDGSTNLSLIPEEGTVYLIVVHENYFTWSDSIPVRNMMAYSFHMETSLKESFSLGETQRFMVSPEEGAKLIEIAVANTTNVRMNASKIFGDPTFLLTQFPQFTFLYISEMTGMQYLDALGSVNDHSLFQFLPGKYFAILKHDENSIEQNVIELESHLTPTCEALDIIPLSYQKPSLLLSDKEIIEFEPYTSTSDVLTNSTREPCIIPFEYNDLYSVKPNITLERVDNPNMHTDYDVRFKIFATPWEYSRYDPLMFNALNEGMAQEILLTASADSTVSNFDSWALNPFMNPSEWLKGTGVGNLMLWPYDIQVRNLSESVDWVDYNDSLFLEVGISHQTPAYEIHNITVTEEVNTASKDVNFATFDAEVEGTLNKTEYEGLLLQINGTDSYEWYQIIISTNLTGFFSSLDISFIFDDVWNAKSAPDIERGEISPEEANITLERGFVAQNFWIKVAPSELLANEIEYSISIKTFNISRLGTPEVVSKFKVKLPSWWPYAAGFGGGAIAIGAAVFIFIKKRR